MLSNVLGSGTMCSKPRERSRGPCRTYLKDYKVFVRRLGLVFQASRYREGNSLKDNLPPEHLRFGQSPGIRQLASIN